MAAPLPALAHPPRRLLVACLIAVGGAVRVACAPAPSADGAASGGAAAADGDAAELCGCPATTFRVTMNGEAYCACPWGFECEGCSRACTGESLDGAEDSAWRPFR